MESSEGSNRLLNAQEVSKYLRISLSTVHHLTRIGKLKSVKMGKYWRYRKEDLDDYLENGFEGMLSSFRYQGEERRRFRRVPCRLRADFGIAAGEKYGWSGDGEILDISDGGVLAEIGDLALYNQQRYLKSPVAFRVWAEDREETSFELTGEIVRMESFAKTRLGIRLNQDFPGLPEELGLERGLN